MTASPTSFALWLTCLLSITASVSSASYGSCNSTESTFYCASLCGGSVVGDCFDCPGYLSADEDHGICFDRRLFQPHNTDPNDYDDHYHYLWNDLVGAVVWLITAGISIACGVGGGGIYVPIGILLFRFAPKQASGFSQASIFGAALAGLILNSRKHHPREDIYHNAGIPSEDRALAKQKELSKDEQASYEAVGGKLYTRPLINYDMALFMSPMQMAGAVLGVLIQKILPNWLYLLIAGCVLSFTSYKTYKKYFASRKTENAKREAAKEAADAQTEADVPAMVDTAENGKEVDSEHVVETGQLETPETCSSKDADANELENGIEAGNNDKEQTSNQAQRIEYLEADMRQYPKEKIGALVLLWIGLFILTLMKGGKGVESLVGIDCESPWFGVVIACQFVWLFCFAAFFGRKLMKDQEARIAVDYPYLGDEDPAWDAPSMRFYGGFCFVSGVVAALIGIGGGMVLGPLMLIMGVDPRVSTATNSTMIVVTSSSIAIMFVTSGLVPWSYALFYFCVTFSGAWIGKSKIDSYVKRTGRASMLIFILASIIAFATVGCFVIFVTRLAKKDWCFDDFQPFCNVNNENQCPANRMLNMISGPGDW